MRVVNEGAFNLSSLRGLGSLVFEGALYLSARSNQGNTVCGIAVIHLSVFGLYCYLFLLQIELGLEKNLPCFRSFFPQP